MCSGFKGASDVRYSRCRGGRLGFRVRVRRGGGATECAHSPRLQTSTFLLISYSTI